MCAFDFDETECAKRGYMRVGAPERCLRMHMHGFFAIIRARGDGSETFSESSGREYINAALFGFAQMKDCIFNQSVQTKPRLASGTDLIIHALLQRPIPRPFALGKSLVLDNWVNT
jgi:hypothetical protein